MTNETNRGRAQLRDLGPADGVYEVDYVIYKSVKKIKNINFKHTIHRVFTADIRLINGYSLKNGAYALEQDGESICRLKKTGAIWQLDEEEQEGMKEKNEQH